MNKIIDMRKIFGSYSGLRQSGPKTVPFNACSDEMHRHNRDYQIELLYFFHAIEAATDIHAM